MFGNESGVDDDGVARFRNAPDEGTKFKDLDFVCFSFSFGGEEWR